MQLISFDEMKNRYYGGEDSLELTVEKWERIHAYSKSVFNLSHYQELLQGAVVPIFLCTEYANQCRMCPIYGICKQGTSEHWTNLIRVMEAYAVAGDLLPRETLVNHIDVFLNKLRQCRTDALARAH